MKILATMTDLLSSSKICCITQVCLTKGSCLIWWKLVTEELYKIYVFFGGIPFSIVELTLLFEILSDAGCGPKLKKVGVFYF
ncbi:hypothetical protein HanPSC8_Chr04g0146021 [Helianthus annuus]|nr:hypothetical protein HanPSC8_Chr04g0146021 [Helianthus annuus]